MAAAMTARVDRWEGDSDGVSHADLLRQIQTKLDTGQLPSAAHERTWYGPGTGRPCCGCEQPIPATEHEVEVDFAQHPILRFHTSCFRAWRLAADGAQGTAAPPGPR
jgi:hypothetical protein